MLNSNRLLLLLSAATLIGNSCFGASGLSNGGFETNGGAGSNTFSNWTVATQTGSAGNWWVQTGTVAPVNVFSVPVPPEGSFAAMSDGTGPGAQALLQSFTIPAGATSVVLSFRYFRNNVAQDYSTPNSLDYTTVPNQQARVDILTSGAGAFDLGNSVLLNVLQTQPGDTTMDSAYQTVTVDITSTVGGGGTFQLRIVEVDNQAQFEFGVDNVSLTFTAQTAQTITFGPLADQVYGTPPFAISATASSGLPVAFSSLTPGVCTVSGTTVTLANIGTCTIHATQPGNATYFAAAPVDRSFNVTLAAPGGSPFITGQTANTLRNNFTGFLGMQITVGSQAINVTQLGRIFLTGNNQTHIVKLVNASTGADVAGGSVQVTMTPGTPNTYEYATLASPLQLQANTSYYLVSQESNGGDTWYDYTPVTHANVAAVNGPIYQSGPTSYTQVSGSPNYSYVPVSMLYSVAASSPPPAVSITAPAPNAPVSGNLQITATATASPGLSITSVQFKVDTNTSIGPAVLNSPYQTTLDTTTLPDGVHTLTAVATDSAGASTTSAPVSVNVSNGVVVPTGTEFITGATFGAQRNNYTGYLGMQFTVGSQALTVNGLGRVYVAGNSATHIVKLVNSNGTDVAGGSVSINMNGSPASTFKYAALATPLTLPAGTSYYLVSQETAGGDKWYDYGPVTKTSVAGINGPVYLSGGSYVLVPSAANESFVPVSFLYTVSTPVNTPPTVTVTAPSAGPATGTIAFNATATANGGLQMMSLQLKVDGISFGSPNTTAGATQQINSTLDTTTLTAGPHTLTAVGIDSANNTTVSAPVTINVSNQTSPPPPAFITGQSFGTVRNNFSGFVGMKFTTGAAALSISQLGRICVAGNSQSHTVKLALASNSTDVPGGSVSVSMAGCTAGQYQYAPLAGPVSLTPNTAYYLVSQETNGGDQWYDYAPVTASAGTVNGPVYFAGGYFLVPSAGASYVPVNFKYNVSNSPAPTVSITAPAQGALVSGTVTITATAAAASGLTIQKVQFQQNGTNIGAAVSGPGPYSVQLDTTTLNSGSSYNLTAIATDSVNNTTTSSPVTVTVNNNPQPGGSPLITGQTAGTLRNNFTGFVGMQFSTTGTAIVANSLGRMCVAGNNGSHLLKLVSSNGTDLAGGSTTVNMAGCTPGQYKYATLSAPLQLNANASYYLVSQELATGDQWYDYAPVTPAPVATVNGPVYFASGYQLVPSPGYSYVPVNMLYQ